ncbi:Vms1/Ankzf1 family peptidyl-tRNA hydrolase [Kitasatospora atroaurantiaca]|uniref:Peptide subunit release factor 1 (ERF1) n=1 Tax=Kitasatospora atroaurantiaca TaxID=285545 RepID=A0A561EZN1_9ACTN|nr:hypothetical protein [Kitasatospora atroaurantiaca]TWE21069.1 hypothetical protein FB465_6236 [Kitasatospora atroaurantiaca]
MELAFLSPLLDRPGPWASVYLETSRNTEDAAKQQELRERAAGEQLAAQGVDSATWAALRAHLAAEPVSRAPAGRALFATGGEVVLDLPLETPPPAPETAWTALPHLSPLLRLRGEEYSCLVAYIDRTGADIEVRDAQSRKPIGQAEGGQAEGRQWQGRGHRSVPADRYEWHYQHKVHDTWERTAVIIADEIARCWRDSGARMLVLAGDPRERRAVHELLPQPLRQVAVEVEGAGRAAGSSPERLDRQIAQVREDRARAHLDEALEQFRAGRGRPGEHGSLGPDTGPGEAAEGIPAVVDAARRHQVATLLVQESAGDVERPLWVGPEPDQLAVRRAEAQTLGVAAPEQARADDALLRSAIAAGAEALLVPDEVAGPAGGLGAILRWSDHPA